MAIDITPFRLSFFLEDGVVEHASSLLFAFCAFGHLFIILKDQVIRRRAMARFKVILSNALINNLVFIRCHEEHTHAIGDLIDHIL